MTTLNKVTLIGYLGNDPEIRKLPDGILSSNVSIATSNRYKNRAGDMVDETEWHQVSFYGKLAEIVEKYLKKGSLIYVEGVLKTRKFMDKNGVEKSATTIVAKEMKMLGGKQGIAAPNDTATAVPADGDGDDISLNDNKSAKNSITS